MSVRIRCWDMSGHQFIVKAGTNGQAFDKADDKGAVRIVNGLGEIYRKLQGEWFSIGLERKKP